MSDVGLSSNIYRISSKYLERFNKFLVEVSFNPEQISQEHADSIHALLKQLSDRQTTDFQIQMIYIVIDKYLSQKNYHTPEVLQKLLAYFEENSYRQPEAIHLIEMLSAALDKECDRAFSRIQRK